MLIPLKTLCLCICHATQPESGKKITQINSTTSKIMFDEKVLSKDSIGNPQVNDYEGVTIDKNNENALKDAQIGTQEKVKSVQQRRMYSKLFIKIDSANKRSPLKLDI